MPHAERERELKGRLSTLESDFQASFVFLDYGQRMVFEVLVVFGVLWI